ncbi:uncharacterized protein V6R79_017966, partial [Siganus canaliculatus]
DCSFQDPAFIVVQEPERFPSYSLPLACYIIIMYSSLRNTPAFHLSQVCRYKSELICKLNYCRPSIARSQSSIHPTLHKSQQQHEQERYSRKERLKRDYSD